MDPSELHFSSRAYSKMVLHAAKYPHAAINGLLLAEAKSKNSKDVFVVDAVPLFHQVCGIHFMRSLVLFRIHLHYVTKPCVRPTSHG